MAQLNVVYWRDIPAQVIVREGRRTAKRQLASRFQSAIDRAAMKAKLRDAESYLEQWTRGAPVDCSGDLEMEAAAAAERLEREYDDDRLAGLVAAGGVERA